MSATGPTYSVQKVIRDAADGEIKHIARSYVASELGFDAG
jgi:hypothetical protein